MPAANYSVTRPISTFPSPEARAKISACWFSPAPAAIRPRGIPTRIVRTGADRAAKENAFDRASPVNQVRSLRSATTSIGTCARRSVRSCWAVRRRQKNWWVNSSARPPVLGTDNEHKLKLIVTPQICELYGTDFRSTPVFFVQDDHDYFENDEATEQIVTFPPDDFMLRLARASQRCITPNFCPTPAGPSGCRQAAPRTARPTCRNHSGRCASAGCWKS